MLSRSHFTFFQIPELILTPSVTRHVTLQIVCSVHVSDGGGTWINLVSEGGRYSTAWYWFSSVFGV